MIFGEMIFESRTVSEAVISLLMTTEGGGDSFGMQDAPNNVAGNVIARYDHTPYGNMVTS